MTQRTFACANLLQTCYTRKLV